MIVATPGATIGRIDVAPGKTIGRIDVTTGVVPSAAVPPAAEGISSRLAGVGC
jgi:hypothetical protein